MQYPQAVADVLRRLTEAGEEAYLVGGSLRDWLGGREPHDWDVTTSAGPERMKQIFSDKPLVETGLAHGTLTVLSGGLPIEVTTFRVDGTYSDSRHPDRVTFTRDLAEDLARRDFTVNAMAYAETTGLVDLYGGRADLAAGIIRCVGDPETRFREDALRIMRAYRLSSELGFTIEARTLAATHTCRDGLRAISRERVMSELSRLLLGDRAEDALREMYRSDVMPYVLGCPCERPALTGFSALPRHLPVRLAAVLTGVAAGKREAALLSLKPSSRLTSETRLILEAETIDRTPTASSARYFISRYGDLTADALAFTAWRGYQTEAFAACVAQAEATPFPRSVREMAIRGEDLLPLSEGDGVWIGRALTYIWKRLLDEGLPDDKETEWALACAYREETHGSM